MMTPFERLAWRCSSIARIAFVAAVGAILVEWLAGPTVGEPGALRWSLRGGIVALLLLGVSSHIVVQRHAVRPGALPPGTDRGRLEVELRLGFGYGRWRRLMRAHHPELRSGPNPPTI